MLFFRHAPSSALVGHGGVYQRMAISNACLYHSPSCKNGNDSSSLGRTTPANIERTTTIEGNMLCSHRESLGGSRSRAKLSGIDFSCKLWFLVLSFPLLSNIHLEPYGVGANINPQNAKPARLLLVSTLPDKFAGLVFLYFSFLPSRKDFLCKPSDQHGATCQTYHPFPEGLFLLPTYSSSLRQPFWHSVQHSRFPETHYRSAIGK